MSIRQFIAGENPSASHLNQIVDAINGFSAGTSDGIIAVTHKNLRLDIPLLRRRLIGTGMRICEVVTNATGGGYYNCLMQNLNAGANWNTDDADVTAEDDVLGEVEVLNLNEHNGSSHTLAAGDLMSAWRITDIAAANNEGAVWVGAPVAGGTGTAVYARQSNHATAGQYNCFLQAWGLSDWTDADAVTVIVKNVRESSGHAFTAVGDRFLAVGAADSNGRVPVIPLGYAHVYNDT